MDLYGKNYQEVKEKRIQKIKELEYNNQTYDKYLFETVLDN